MLRLSLPTRVHELLHVLSMVHIRNFAALGWDAALFFPRLFLYWIWIANNYLNQLLALSGRPPRHYYLRTKVKELEGVLEAMQHKKGQYKREIEELQHEAQELRASKKEAVLKWKEARRQVLELQAQLEIFRQQTRCSSGEQFRSMHSVTGQHGLIVHVSSLMAAMMGLGLQSSADALPLQRLVLLLTAVGGCLYLLVLLQPAPLSTGRAQLLLSTNWCIIGLVLADWLLSSTAGPFPDHLQTFTKRLVYAPSQVVAALWRS